MNNRDFKEHLQEIARAKLVKPTVEETPGQELPAQNEPTPTKKPPAKQSTSKVRAKRKA